MREEWEYKIMTIRVNDYHEEEHGEKTLNKMGKEGWELVAVIRPNEDFDCVCLLKRRQDINPSIREVDKECILSQ